MEKSNLKVVRDEAEVSEQTNLIHPTDVFQKGTVQKYVNNIAAIDQYLELLVKHLELNPIAEAPENNKVQLAFYRMEMYQAIDKRDSLKSFLKLREDEFYQGYLPRFEKQLEECNKHFETYYSTAKHICQYLKPNYFVTGVNNYPERNPGDRDLRLRISFFKFLVDELPKMEVLAKKNPEYKAYNSKK